MDKLKLVYSRHAERDLLKLAKKNALQVLQTLELLERPPWPSSRVKKLRGQNYWEIRTGNYRTLFVPEGGKVFILRVIHRRDLLRTIKHINVAAVLRWLEKQKEE